MLVFPSPLQLNKYQNVNMLVCSSPPLLSNIRNQILYCLDYRQYTQQIVQCLTFYNVDLMGLEIVGRLDDLDCHPDHLINQLFPVKCTVLFISNKLQFYNTAHNFIPWFQQLWHSIVYEIVTIKKVYKKESLTEKLKMLSI